MSSARRQSRRYTELAQFPGEGARDPIEVGCWVVAADRDLVRPMALVLVAAGPHYQHADGIAITAHWQLHDGSWRPATELTRLDLTGVLEEATSTLSGLARCRKPPDSEAVILRIHRAACLARRAWDPHLPSEALTQLDSLIAIDLSLAAAEAAWRDMIRTWLPNLARALAAVAACELARCPFWTPGEGRVHPLYPFIASDHN